MCVLVLAAVVVAVVVAGNQQFVGTRCHLARGLRGAPSKGISQLAHFCVHGNPPWHLDFQINDYHSRVLFGFYLENEFCN